MGIEITFSDRSKNPDLLTQAKKALESTLRELQQANTHVLLLLSGGSSLALLEGQDTTVIGTNVTIAPFDERYTTNPTVNNMAQIAATDFFAKAIENGAKVIDTRIIEGESMEELAKRFNNALVEWINANPEGKIIATIGIGPDGHVSGIMPYPEDPEGFFSRFDDKNDEHLVVWYDAGDKNQYSKRVTTTMNLIRKIDTSIAFVAGESKKEAVRNVLSDEGSLAATPARILKEIPGKVLLFTDQG